MNLSTLAEHIAARFRWSERAAPAVYECGADRDADLVQFALGTIFTDPEVAAQVKPALGRGLTT